VINPRFAKPIDRTCVGEYGRNAGSCDSGRHVLAGGFGSAVLEARTNWNCRFQCCEWAAGRIHRAWQVEALREKYGLTAEAALEKARPYLATLESRRMVLR